MLRFLILFSLFASQIAFAGPSRYDWGTEPSGITLAAWPDAPSANTAVSVATIGQLNSAIALGDQYITLTADITGDITITTNDNLIDLDGYTLTGEVALDAVRTEIANGFVDGPLYIDGSHNMIYNVESDNSTPTSSILGDGHTVAIVNSSLFNSGGYPIFCSEYHSHNLIIANSELVATVSGPNAGLRCMGVDNIVLVDSRIVGIDNAPLRLHAGDLVEGATGGMNNVWVTRTQFEGSGTGGIFINLYSGVPIDPGAVFDRILIDDNTMWETSFEINQEEEVGSKYTNFTVTNNFAYFDAAYNGGDKRYNWTLTLPWAGADATWYFPIGAEGDANDVFPSATTPVYNGGYGTNPNPPGGSPSQVLKTSAGGIRPTLRF